jgi:hypothetical protein
MTKNDEWIKVIEDLINETEGKLQEAIKKNKNENEIESIKTVLKYLREKKRKLIDKNDL